MARRILVTESQFRKMLAETDIAVNLTGGDVRGDIQNSVNDFRKAGGDPNKANMKIDYDDAKNKGIVSEDSGDGINAKYVAYLVLSDHPAEELEGEDAENVFRYIHEALVKVYGEGDYPQSLYTDVLNAINTEEEPIPMFESFTKGQVQKARVNKVMSESKKTYSKKDLITHVRK